MIGLYHDLLFFLGQSLAFFYDLIPNYGVAIVLLTVGVRLVMLPLTIKQTRSMQEMQILQPELKRLQAKYKGGDRQKLNEEMMKLYKEHHVNPLGGCLPLLLQLPVFWALYRALDGCEQTVGKTKVCTVGFAGAKYLPKGSALYDAIHALKARFLGMDLGISPVAALHQHGGLLHAAPYFGLVLLMIATTWYQQKQMMAVSTGQQAAQMQMMGKVMPLLLGVFSLNLPTGVSIYWVSSNLWTIGQQAFMLGKPKADAGTAGTGGAAAKPSGQSGSGDKGGTAKTLPRAGAKPEVRPKPDVGPKNKPAGTGKVPVAGSTRIGPRRPKPAVDEGSEGVSDEVEVEAVADQVDEVSATGPAAAEPSSPGAAKANASATGKTYGKTKAKQGAQPGPGSEGVPVEAADAVPAASASQRTPSKPATSGRPAGSRSPGGQGASRGGSNARKKRRR